MPKETPTLFAESAASWTSLPADYEPVRPKGFDVARIVFAKGSQTTPERRRFVESICALYPSASLIECSDLPHNRIDLGEADPVALHSPGGSRSRDRCSSTRGSRTAHPAARCPRTW